MEFRWIAGIALWTLLMGPIAGVPTGSSSKAPAHAAKVVKAKPAPAPRR
jgi:hypothetical protein